MYELDLEPRTGFYLIDAALTGDLALFKDVFGHSVLPASISASPPLTISAA